MWLSKHLFDILLGKTLWLNVRQHVYLWEPVYVYTGNYEYVAMWLRQIPEGNDFTHSICNDNYNRMFALFSPRFTIFVSI